MKKVETEIRSIGAEFAVGTDLPVSGETPYTMKYINRCTELASDNDDRGIYGDDSYKTVVAASQLKKRHGLEKGMDFPQSITFHVDEKHRIIVL